MRPTVVVALFLQKLVEPPEFHPAQVLEQPAHRCPGRNERATGIRIGKTGNLAHHNVSVVVEKSLQNGTLAGRLLVTTIGALGFCHAREASTARCPCD